MQIGACLWSLPEDPDDAAVWAEQQGFDYIDVDPGFASRGESTEGLPVASVAIAHLMPDGAALESGDHHSHTRALEHLRAGIAEAAGLGADFVYVPPATADDQASHHRWKNAIVLLADEANALDLTFGIEHFPGYALPSVSMTCDFVNEIAHPNVYVLLDIGHAQISGESIPGVLGRLGNRMAFVHFDDNLGEKDDHVALLEGLQTEEQLVETVRALKKHGYDGRISIEMSPKLPDPRGATIRSLEILRRVLDLA